MRYAMATSPGHGLPDEDFVAAVPGALVMVDGAGILGAEGICRHGTAWYSHTLGGEILGRIPRGGGLVDLLGASIEAVAARHRHSCDLANPSSPQAAVAIVRTREDDVEWLVLGDAYVVLDGEEGAEVQTDPRETAARAECAAPLAGLEPGSAAYEQALPGVRAALRARRNVPGGYWVAKESGAVAAHARHGALPSAGLRGVGLLSNGAAQAVDPHRLTDWAGLAALLREEGPEELLARLREAETIATAADPDDATAAYLRLRAPRASRRTP